VSGFSRPGPTPVAIAVIAGGVALIILHAVALGSLLLGRRQALALRRGVFLGGIGLLAVSGAAVLTVAFPQLVPQRP